jgi:glycosyltransferase involved in cell wall biosynthesis
VRIALVNQPWNPVVPPVRSGSVAIWIYQIALRLARTHDVTVFGPRTGNEPDTLAHEGVRFRWLDLGQDLRIVRALHRLPRLPGRPAFASRLYYRTYTRSAATALRDGGFDVVHVQNLLQMVRPLRRASPHSAIVLHMHCEWLSQLPKHFVARRLAGVAAILCCSEHIARLARQALPAFADRCRVVPNGVDTERFAPGEPTARRDLLFVGRISPEKGVHVLLDAFAKIAARRFDTRLVLVGPMAPTPRDFLVSLSDDPLVRDLDRLYRGGGYEAAVRALAGGPLAGRVELRGAVPQDELPAVYRSAAVLVNPSLSESFGMSLVEAMACGVPVVATRVGGMPEIVDDGRTGRLVPPGDPAALADALDALLADEPARRALGQAGLRRARERFAWDRIAAGLQQAYGALARGADR